MLNSTVYRFPEAAGGTQIDCSKKVGCAASLIGRNFVNILIKLTLFDKIVAYSYLLMRLMRFAAP